MDRGYKIGEFAELAGVTVKALHHYDRIGLLKPQRSCSGTRVYSLLDLERMEQIAALKFLGISLSEIKRLLGSCKTLTLLKSLDFQLEALRQKRKLIDSAMRAIKMATESIRSGHATDASILKKILETMDMQPQENFMRKYYAEQAWLDKVKLRTEMPSGVREELSRSWKQVFTEVEAALDADPASETAQALTQRWLLLADASAGDNDGIKAGGIRAWKDHENWPPMQQAALLSAYGLDLNDRTASMHRVERVANFIGQAISHQVQSNWQALYKPKEP
jgi:DNA-binding transcriptional MerR regulator